MLKSVQRKKKGVCLLNTSYTLEQSFPNTGSLIQTLEPWYQIPSRPHFSDKVLPALYKSIHIFMLKKKSRSSR